LPPEIIDSRGIGSRSAAEAICPGPPGVAAGVAACLVGALSHFSVVALVMPASSCQQRGSAAWCSNGSA